jgi:hypothetical protein
MKFIVFAVVASLFTLAVANSESLEAEKSECYYGWCFQKKSGLQRECCPGYVCPTESQGFGNVETRYCEPVSLMFSLRQVFSLMAIEIGIQVGDGHLRVGDSEQTSVTSVDWKFALQCCIVVYRTLASFSSLSFSV